MINKIIFKTIVILFLSAIFSYINSAPVFAGSNTPFYFVAIHNEPFHDENLPGMNIKECYQTLRKLINKADKYNIRLTLMFTPQWVDYILADPERTAELNKWKKQGHEIAAHHHEIFHANWDGYTNYSSNKFLKVRQNIRLAKGFEPESYLGSMADYIRKLKLINQD